MSIISIDQIYNSLIKSRFINAKGVFTHDFRNIYTDLFEAYVLSIKEKDGGQQVNSKQIEEKVIENDDFMDFKRTPKEMDVINE